MRTQQLRLLPAVAMLACLAYWLVICTLFDVAQYWYGQSQAVCCGCVEFAPQVKQIGGPAAVGKVPLVHIPHPPTSDSQTTLATLAQAAQQRKEHTKAALTHTTGDSVSTFGEAAAAAGFLGRFPGSEVMQLVQRFNGRLA